MNEAVLRDRGFVIRIQEEAADMNESSAQKPIRDYKDLHVWQKAMELAKQIYLLTSRFPSCNPACPRLFADLDSPSRQIA